MVGGEFLVSGCKNPDAGPAMSFSEEDITLLEEIAETILPQTTTAGAKAAGVGRFMTVWVNDCYTKEDQEKFYAGLAKLDATSTTKYGKGFMDLDLTQKNDIALGAEAQLLLTNSFSESPSASGIFLTGFGSPGSIFPCKSIKFQISFPAVICRKAGNIKFALPP